MTQYQGIGMRAWLVQGLIVSLVLATTAIARAQAPGHVVRVEEDWELVIGEPEPLKDSPQITCVTSPVGHVDSLYGAFDLNHQSLQNFVPGGLQLQVWEGETPLRDNRFPNAACMVVPGESVRWTQAMDLNDGLLTFEILNGHSTAWGHFGGQGYLKASINTDLTDLDAYSPEVSVGASGIGFAPNCVQVLVLKAVRRYTSTGQVIEDHTLRVVHPQ